ncbi:MAG TPA: DoxX family protein [Candidatus Binatia bacterium]|nr:DoxX family protein [Candidatus Binatia bacterium]
MTTLEDRPTETQLVFPALGPLYARFSPYTYGFMRFCLGAALAPHGFYKLFLGTAPVSTMVKLGLMPPVWWAYLVGCTEFFGGILLALGLFTRFAALAIAIEMTVTTFVLQWPNGYFWTGKGFEFPLLIWLFCIAIFFRGGGRYSLDHKIGKEL